MKWTRVPASQLPRFEEVHKSKGGVTVTFRASPFDVPEAFRGRFDEDEQVFVIEFRYLANEPLIRESHDPVVWAETGRNSGRLYRLGLDVKALKAQSVAVEVQAVSELKEAIECLITKHPTATTSYRAARALANSVINSRDFKEATAAL